MRTVFGRHVLRLSLMIGPCLLSACEAAVSDGTKAGQLTCQAFQAMTSGNFADAQALEEKLAPYKEKVRTMLMNARQRPEYEKYSADVRAVVSSCISNPKDRDEAAFLFAGVIAN